MEHNYYIQKTGEKAKSIWHFFIIYADLGVLSSEPITANENDVYVNSSTLQVGTYLSGSWNYEALEPGEYVHDALNRITYIFESGELKREYLYEEGVAVTRTKNLTNLPERKEMYVENWKDQQGEDTYVSEHAFYGSKEVTLSFFIQNESIIGLRNNIDQFLKYVAASGHINYFDTLKNQGFRGYYKSHEISQEKYKAGKYWQEFNIVFVADKLCYGYDSTQCNTLTIDINEDMGGTYELYLSNGDYGIFDQDSYISSANCKFVIIVPQYLDLVTLYCGEGSAIGVSQDGNLVIGLTSNGDHVIGI